MSGGIGHVIAAAAFLLITHFGVSSTRLRGVLIDRVGQRTYLGLYSTVAAVALVWLAFAYATAPYVGLWPAGAALRGVPIVVLPFALFLLIGGLTAPNPTSVGQEGVLARPDAARGVLRITRNPVLWAIGLWALAHMAANGDVASLVFFGSLAVLALGGTMTIDAKNARHRGEGWGRFAAVTSNLPFVAILQGRQRIVWSEIGFARIAGAVALYLALLILHPWLFGVAALPAALPVG